MRARWQVAFGLLAAVGLFAGCSTSPPTGEGGGAPPQPGFALALNPDRIAVVQGGSRAATLTVTAQNGFRGTVQLQLRQRNGSPAPSGIHLSPGQVDVNADTVRVDLSFQVEAGVSPGTYDLRLVGVSGDLQAQVDFSLQVTAPPGAAWRRVTYRFVDVAYGNGTFVAAAEGEALYSSDGRTWNASGEFPVTPKRMIFCEESGEFVAVSGSSGSQGYILASEDGREWFGDGPNLNAYADVACGSGYYVAIENDDIPHHHFNGVVVYDHYNFLNGASYDLEAPPLNRVIFADGKFVVVGELGAIYVGTPVASGIRWESPNLGIDSDLHDVAYGGGRLVAVGDDGTVLVSGDGGETWASADVGTSQDLHGVAYGGGTFVVVGEGGTLLTSSDGAQWRLVNSGTDRDLYRVAYLGDRFLALGDGGTLLVSPDAQSWTAVETRVRNRITGVAYGGGTYVYVGGVAIGTYDGSESRLVFGAAASGIYEDVAYSDRRYVVVGGPGGIVLTSLDRQVWVTASVPTFAWLSGVVHGAGKFVAVGEGGTILTSEDGVRWNAVDSGTTAGLNAVGYGGGLYVAVGGEGTILVSHDGESWQPRDSGTGVRLTAVAYGNGTFVVVGEDGTVLTSTDGSEWQARNAGTAVWFAGVAYGSGRFVAVGEWGTIAVSQDGTNWSTQDVGDVYLEDIAYGEGRFVAVGSFGKILTSTDGRNWAEEQSGVFSSLYGVAVGDSGMVAVGEESAIVVSP